MNTELQEVMIISSWITDLMEKYCTRPDCPLGECRRGTNDRHVLTG
jgi:hypothetical protein